MSGAVLPCCFSPAGTAGAAIAASGPDFGAADVGAGVPAGKVGEGFGVVDETVLSCGAVSPSAVVGTPGGGVGASGAGVAGGVPRAK